MVIAKHYTLFNSAEKRLVHVLLLIAHFCKRMLAGEGHCEGQLGQAG
jgi:hypothetical protein